MQLCPKCRKRLAKRLCPALGSNICQLCCGTKREKEIPCPASCVHLVRSRAYQAERVAAAGQGRQAAGDAGPAADKRLWPMVFYLEAALAEYASMHPDFNDGDAGAALGYARDKAGKPASLIVLPDARSAPTNEAGENMLRVLENVRPEPSAIVTAMAQPYSSDEKKTCLNWLIKTASETGRPGTRIFLDDLIEAFARLKKEPQGGSGLLAGS